MESSRKYFKFEHRQVIEKLLRDNPHKSLREIFDDAPEVPFDRSSVQREIKMNGGRFNYSAEEAQKTSYERKIQKGNNHSDYYTLNNSRLNAIEIMIEQILEKVTKIEEKICK